MCGRFSTDNIEYPSWIQTGFELTHGPVPIVFLIKHHAYYKYFWDFIKKILGKITEVDYSFILFKF